MSRVLLLVNEEAHARELARVADHLLKSSDLKPVYFVDDRMRSFGIKEHLLASGVETLGSDDLQNWSNSPPGILSGWRRWANVIVKFACGLGSYLPKGGGPALRFFAHIGRARDELLRRVAICQALLASRSYVTLVICEDNVAFDTELWIAAARRNKVRIVIVPYTIANVAELAEGHVYSPSTQITASIPNRVVGWLFPKWVLSHRNRRFLRLPYAKIFALEILGFAPTNPWLLNGGPVDAIAVESPAMRAHYLASGVGENRLVLTGTLVDDTMVTILTDTSRLRGQLFEQVGQPPNRPLLLCAFPPNQKTFDRPGCEFVSYDDLVEFWARCLSEVKGWDILVVAHPKTRREELDALTKYGLALSDRDTASLIPLCDLYVASVSATIRWAIACGKPVINHDVYRFNYQDYRSVEAVMLAQTREEFRKLLADVTADPARLEYMRAAQQRDAHHWGCYDGKSGRRLLALICGEHLSSLAA